MWSPGTPGGPTPPLTPPLQHPDVEGVPSVSTCGGGFNPWTPGNSRGTLARVLLDTSLDGGVERARASRECPAYAVWQASRDLRRVNDASRDPAAAHGREDSGEAPPMPWGRNVEGMRSILKHPFTLLLLAFPLGCLSYYLGWDCRLTFWLNFVAMIPLAKMLGDATEELDACIHNEVVSGLLNATFGNAVEMIMTIQTLKAGLLDVVKATLLGSVLSNMLLVLGMSFFFGGIVEPGGRDGDGDGRRGDGRGDGQGDSRGDFGRTPDVSAADSVLHQPLLPQDRPKGMHFVAEKEQTFIVNGALVSVTMLLVSCLSFALPTVFAQAFTGQADTVLDISRTTACIVMLSYFAYLVFQLITHRKMLANAPAEGEDEAEDEGLTVGFAIGLLFATTVLVAICSQVVVDVIESVAAKSHLDQTFIGVVLLPIVGNACEHAAAVRFAMQNKPGLSVSIAVGSSTQVALFVVPFAVLMGWAMGQPMDLNFGGLNITVLIISVLVVLTIVVDGRSNWLEGYMLCSSYAIIAVMYWHVQSFSGNRAMEL